jgi:outer membrane protein assembly factor BamB
VLAAALLAPTMTTSAGAATGTVTSWKSAPLDGVIQGAPAVVGTVAVVATENDSLYGLSLRDGHILWGPRHIGDPVTHAVIAEVSPSATGCGNIDPLGITSSLAVDVTTNPPRVFAVAEVQPPTTRTPVHELVGVEAPTGQLVVGPTPVDPPGMTNPEVQQQRAGLTVANGKVYIGFGGLYGDCGDYHGFVVAAREDGGGIAGAVEFADAGAGNRAAGVWSTAAPAIDATGNVYVATGNGKSSPAPPATDHSDAVVRLPPGLGTVASEFQPTSWQSDNATDLDLGSTAPVLVGAGQVFEVGKQHHAFLLDGANLGGTDGHTPLASLDVCSALGGNGAIGASVYVACQGGVQQVVIDRATTPPRLRHGWTAPVSADGPVTVGAGLVWSVDTSDHVLYGLDPANGRVVAQHPVSLDASQHFPTPAVGAGWVLVESADRVAAFRISLPKAPARRRKR